VHELERADVIPIGRPIANTTVHFVDRTGAPVPVGVPGELLIGGLGVARGYHDRPELTAARFIDHPQWGRVYATGDVATVRHDGIVEFGGRIDNQVKVRGHRIELGEIENALEDDPQIARAVVVAVPIDGVTELVAYVMPKDTATFDLALVQRGLASRLPDPMLPRAFEVLDTLPTMPNGKTDRVRLAQRAASIFERTAATVSPSPTAPTTRVVAGGATIDSAADEAAVIEIWSNVLGHTIGRDDNFFEVGGHSLLAVKVFRLLTERVAVPLALTDLFRFPNARALGAHLAASRTSDQTAGDTAAARAPTATGGDDRGARRRNALLGRGRNA
jgi:hypothetical protein